MLRLLKRLYGLSDAGDHLFTTLVNHLRNYISMSKSLPYPALFLKMHESNQIGLTVTNVDDPMNTGSKYFQRLSDTTAQPFDSKPTQFGNVTFAGVDFSISEGKVNIYQSRAS